jgi:hypothetical protein
MVTMTRLLLASIGAFGLSMAVAAGPALADDRRRM